MIYVKRICAMIAVLFTVGLVQYIRHCTVNSFQLIVNLRNFYMKASYKNED